MVPQGGDARALIVVAGGRICAIPVHHVAETMRPLPTDRLAGAPAFVAGVAMIRGAATPVVDLAAVLGDASAPPERYVTVRAGARIVALAVERVAGVRAVAELAEMPPLLHAVRPEVIEAIGVADGNLLVVLRTSRLLSAELWAALAAAVQP